MINEGKSLEELLKAEETQQEESVKLGSDEKVSAKNKAQRVPTKPLNADIPETLMRDLKLIAAHNGVTIKDIVCAELSKYVKREKRKMIESLGD